MNHKNTLVSINTVCATKFIMYIDHVLLVSVTDSILHLWIRDTAMTGTAQARIKSITHDQGMLIPPI